MGIDTNTEIISRFLPIRRRGLSGRFSRKESELLARVRESGKFPQAHDNLEELAKLVGSNDLTRKGDKAPQSRGIHQKTKRRLRPLMTIPRPNTSISKAKERSCSLLSKGGGWKIALTSGEGVPARDPTGFELYGSLDGKTFKEIAKGAVPTFSKRRQRVEIAIENSALSRSTN